MGQAFSFAGSNGIINIPATADLDTPNAVTVAAWVKPSSFVVPLFGNTYPMIVGKAGNYQMDLEHDGRLSFGFPGGPGGTGSNTSVTSLSTVPTTSFTFMAGTYDSSTGKLRVYINGVLENESGASGLINSASVALQIGGFYGTGYGAVTGLIDEVRLYSRALSPTEIQAVYALKTCDAPALTSVSPTSGIQGQQNLTVTLTGQNTHFAQGTTTASFGTGVTTNSLTVTSPTTALAVIGIDALAASGGRDVSITTGAEVVTLANAFAVILGAPSILIVNPNTTQQGRQGLAVELTGQLTHFLQGTTQANFGAGITIASFTVNSGASATAVLNVSSTAAVGLRDVTLTTGTEVVTLSGGFTIGSGVCSAPPPGLLAWWPGEGNGNDLAGLHNGALQGGTSFVSGLAGQGFHFDGSTGLMLVPFTQDLDLRDAVTMQAWVNPSSYLTPSGPSVTGYVLISGRPYSYQMTLRPDGHALFSFPSGTSGVFVNVRIDSATVVPKGTFTLISASYSSAQGRLRIYLNGSLDKEVAYTGLMDSVSKPFFLGAYSDPSLPAGYGAWTGTVDEVQLFNRELTPAEVLATFALGSFGYCKDLPKISSVSPNSGQQGQLALSVSITGQNTHFVQGATIATFGAGITAATLTVNSATSATAVLNIDPAAALGARNVALTTGGEVAMLSNGFTVNLPSCVVPPSALVAWWPGEGNYADIIGFNTGTPTGVVAFAAGEVGQAFSFDGASSVRVPSSSALLLGAGEMTLDAWINTPPWTGIGNFGQIVAKVSPSSPYQGYSLRTTPDNRVEFTASDCGTGGCGFSLPGGPGTRQPIRSISVVANGKWHHVAGVRRADGSREIYVDGVLENTRSEGMWNTDSNTPLYLGAADETGGPQRFTGLIDEVQIFSRALSAAEIQAIFTSGVNGECKTQSVTPVISSVAPSSGKQGQTLQVTLTGFYTHFAQGTTQVSFGTGIAVSNITVSSPTSLTAQLIIDPAAAIGARTPTVTIGTEVVSLIGGFTITSGNLAPVVTASAGCSQTVSILPASITVTEYPVSTVAGGLHGITVGPDCNLWASDYFGHKIWKIGTDGTSTPFPLTSNASDIAAGLDGNLWFTEQLANKIGRISPSGVISEFAIPTSGAPFRFGSTEPINIVAGPDGNMWFTEFAANQIGRITPAGVITEFPIPTGGGPLNGISGSAPEPLTVGPDGNIWFGEGYGGKVGRITPTGVLTEFPVPSPPSAITTGADGNLWFGEIATNKIARMTPGGLVTGEFLIPTSNSVPNWIISGPDGNLWFVEEGGNKIARITTSGVITEFVVPTAGSTPFAIVAAPDGNLWFTENDGRNVGKINPFTGVAIANLTGTVVDDGRPAGATLGTTWTTTNGPASATFSSPSASFSDFAGVTNAVSARATFTAAGVYTLTLTGSDSQLSGLASLQVTVNSAASAPILVSVTPNSGQQGQQSLSITITGQNTHFVQGSTTASLGAGITVTSLTVNSTTTATAVLNIDASAIVASRTIILTTGTEAASLANGFAVTASASIFSVSPNAGPQGQGGPVAIVGVNTHFVQGTTTVDFGAGIIVSNIAITCGTCLTVQLQIDPAAAVGSRTLTVTTGSEVVSLANAFTVQPGIPILTSLVPAQGQQGQTLPVTLTGLYTHWAQGTTQLSFGASITVSNITVSSATSLTAQLAIDGTATVGTRTPTVTTGVEVVSQANIFSVLAAVPIIMTLNPGSGQQGRTNLSVTITGQSTHFVPGTSQASFGAGVTVISLTVASATSATAVINLDPAAAVGARTVTVTTVAEVASFTNGFAIVAGSPSVLSVSPNTSVQGQQSLSIAITGNLTHFVQGTTQASFGAGVTVGSLSITSPTTATAALNIAPTASVGLRGVTLTTGTEVATLQGGFAVNPATLITLLSPSTGQQGQQNLSIAISGQATHFVQGTTTANFGAGITVASLAVSSPTTAAAVLNISAGATLGTRTVTLATGAEAVSLANGFTIGTGNPVVTQVSPNVGRQGQPNLSVTVTGQYTNFAQGVTQVSFGQGITIGSVAVSSSTSLTATITIGATTPLGARTVIVTTGAEVASLANAFSVTTAINQSPIITIAPAWSVTIPARLLVTYSVTDDGLPLGGVLTVSWDTVSTPPGGNVGYQSQTPTSISVGFDTPGNYTLRITVTDTQFTVVKTIAVTATQTVIPPPTVSITTPTDGAEVTGPLNVIGSVGSQALTNWLLEYSGPGETVYHTVSTGTTTVTNASLGTFDPTTLINGTAYLRLTATDTSGQSTTIGPLSVLLTRNQKIGNFTVSFNDVTVPMAGLPIQVVRTYDSRRRFQPGNDFTYGWTLDINGGTLTEAAPLGDQWNETTTGGAFPTYCINPVKVHTYTMALPDGTTYSFLPKLTPQCQSLVPILQSTFGFTPTGATPPNVTLAVVGNNTVAVNGTLGPVTFLDADGFSTFDPDQYILTLGDGRKLQFSLASGLQKLTDLNSNTITLTPGAITHSSGKSVMITRNAAHQITKITDPAGGSVLYGYNVVTGDLTSVTDRSSQTTNFTYRADHGLLTIQDPRGVQPIRNVYDDTGRLVQHIDAYGNTINYTHNTGTRQDIITDRLNNTTVNEYDGNGNVVKVTDPLGGVTTRTYDSRDNLTSETNALIKTRSYTYDATNNRLTETDPLSHTTTYTYNSRNQVTTITDALQRLTTNTYDANGNLTSTKDAANNTTSYAYNPKGQQLSATDALNGTTSNLYDPFGNLTQQTDPLNNITNYTYDSGNNRLTQTKSRTTSNGPETLLTTYQYDASNRLMKTIYPDQSSTQVQYNAIGKQATTIDQLLRQTTYQYDLMGRLTQTNYPDGTIETAAYDAEGNRIASTDRGGRTTNYVYDPLKRLAQTIAADTATTITTYDAIGQVTATRDPLGNTTHYGYDDAGRRTSVTDALTHSTTFAYDLVGNQTSMTDANLNTTRYQYDNLNRRTKTIYPDFTFDSVAYDALGRTSSKTDQANLTTSFQYDKLGRLTQVTDAALQLTKYGYDEVGNRTSQADANIHTTNFGYDKLGRRTKRTLPLGMSETFAYDAAGNLSGKTDFNGKTTTYQYDASNRLTRKTPDASFAANPIIVTYKPSGQRDTMTDASGATSYSYDLRDRLTQKVTPQGTLTYTYDLAGNLSSIRSSNTNGTSVDYSYDVLNRLSTVKDNRLANGTTTYAYDNDGNLQSYTYPNGVATSFTYNGLNRLTNLQIAKGGMALATYGYTLGATGNRTQVNELGGRQVNYTYDSLYRLKSETIAGGTVNGAIGYQYDSVGNRLARTSSVSPVPAASYGYDANDRLLSDSYDANGNTTVSAGVNYGFDFENRLASQTGTVVGNAYDGDGNRGNRVSKTVGGVTTSYLVDDRNLTGNAQVLEELVSETVQRIYAFGLSRISQSQPSGTSFYAYDGHGNVRLLTDGTGLVLDRYNYDAFGNIVETTGSTPNVYLYSGEQVDPNISLYYLRARYLNPSTGRFLTSDPFPGDPESPPSLHRYAFVNGNPITSRDPSGLVSIPELTAAQTINNILDRILIPNIVFPGIVLAVEITIYKPGFEARNAAINLIANSTDPSVIDAALDLYAAGNGLIILGSRTIVLGRDLTSLLTGVQGLGRAAKGVAKSITDPYAAAGKITQLTVKLGEFLQNVDRSVGDLTASLRASNPTKINGASNVTADELRIFFDLALDILISGNSSGVVFH